MRERVEATVPLVAAPVPVMLAVGRPVGVALAERPRAGRTRPARARPAGRSARPETGSGPASGSAAGAPLTGPCSDERRVAAERCDLADRLGEQAAGANQHLRDQQRAYDDLTARAARTALVADPREIRPPRRPPA